MKRIRRGIRLRLFLGKDQMMRKNILIFPAGTEIAFEIYNALKYSKFVRLFGGTSVPCHAEFLFERCIEGFPFIDEAEFADFMNEVVEQYEIDYIYPAHDSVCLKLAQIQTQLRAKVVIAPVETVEICRSKTKTYNFLKGEPYLPAYYANALEVPTFPVFIKPAVGQGSVGARRIDNFAQLEQALSDDTEYTICEYLPGNEYTIDCFTDRHGVLRAAKLRQRERIRAGISVRSRALPEETVVQEIASSINERLQFNGAWFFQLKKNLNDEYRLMEISPRIPGTMAVSRNQGINFPLLTLYNFWGYDVDLLDNGSEMLLDRAFINRFQTNICYQHIYIDFDDTVVVDGKINTQVMHFLYQARNQGKQIFLLTRHAKNIHQSLKEYAISEELFEEIIHVSDEEAKSDYVQRENAIFIDDSFAERKKVNDVCGIPVFDIDMVESLLDWRM